MNSSDKVPNNFDWPATKNLQQIAETITDLTYHYINIMDSKGYVIASTDTRLIGIYDAEAEKLVKEGLDLLHSKTNHITTLEKETTLLPITINNKVIGSISIIGDESPDNNINLYKIIQYLCSQMILEAYRKQDIIMIEEMKRSFIYNWLYQTCMEDWTSFELRGLALGINVNINRIVCILKTPNEQNDFDISNLFIQKTRPNIESTIRLCIDYDKENIAIGIGTKYYVVLLNENRLGKAKVIINEIEKILKKEYKVQIVAGLSSSGRSGIEIQQSFREARIACNIAEHDNDKRLKCFEELNLEILLSCIPKKNKNEFFNKLYCNYDQNDIDQVMDMLRKYVNNNGSICKAAEELHIHKNTLQYQLQRLAKSTGYDARNCEDIIPLIISLKIYEEGIRKTT